MKYYLLKESIDLEIAGNFPQSTDAKHNCHVWDEPAFIEHHELTPIDFEPIVSNAILHNKAKLTDIISTSGMGFTRKLLVSGKLKNIIRDNVNNSNVQFFKSPILYKGQIIDDYWIIYCNKSFSEFIDLSKSIIKIRKRKPEGGTYLENISFENYYSFEFYMIENKLEGKLFFSNICLFDNIDNEFFALKYVEGGIQYFVSEKLKQKIDEAGCTGIEFQPSELSYNEWVAPGGEREKIYGKI
ncbi:hypothetical protein [uncultured Chryseobacterium sp.]|uniref:hypothetical protein n=1 Tax=uncultured Chryseobacterium sp. TaxID=259322 RepID=UPI0025F200F4|nr:hypothetical protein [uncultured Chryseobacterium sp.]